MNKNLYCHILKKMFDMEKMEHAPVRVYGWSMMPIIQKGDIITVVKCKDIMVRDIICFMKFPNHFTVHRVIAVKYSLDGKRYYTKGDNNWYLDDYCVYEYEILGKVLM